MGKVVFQYRELMWSTGAIFEFIGSLFLNRNAAGVFVGDASTAWYEGMDSEDSLVARNPERSGLPE